MYALAENCTVACAGVGVGVGDGLGVGDRVGEGTGVGVGDVDGTGVAVNDTSVRPATTESDRVVGLKLYSAREGVTV